MRFLAALVVVLSTLSMPAQARIVTLYAASSLAPALDAAEPALEAASGTDLRLVYAASGTLARQVAAGAPADLVLLADDTWMDWLAARDGIVPDSRRPLLANRLAVISLDGPLPDIIDSAAALTTALGPDRFVSGEPAAVPVGRYARAALTHFGLWDRLGPRLLPAPSARTAVTWLARGEVRAGLLFHSDALTLGDSVSFALLAQTSHPPIRYPLALTTRDTAAQRVASALHAQPVQALFRAHGFDRVAP